MLPFGDNFGLGAHSVRGAGLGMAWFDLVHGSCYLTGWLFLLGAFRNGDGRFRGSARFLTSHGSRFFFVLVFVYAGWPGTFWWSPVFRQLAAASQNLAWFSWWLASIPRGPGC